MILNYKGIKFDNFEVDKSAEQPHYWGDICEHCRAKYFPDKSAELAFGVLDSGGSPTACCGVKGCNHHGGDEQNTEMFYIDFPNDVTFELDE